MLFHSHLGAAQHSCAPVSLCDVNSHIDTPAEAAGPTAPSAPTATGTVIAAMRQRVATLTPAEVKVVQVILEAGEQLIYRSASEVAEQAGAALSTVVRTCQRLGFKGYQDLKIAIARDGKPVAPSELVGEVTAADSPREVLAKVGSATRDAIDVGLRHVEGHAFDDAVVAIAGARRLLCLGVGTSAPLAADAAYRFLWIGTQSEAPADVHVQHVRSTVLEPGDVALVISHTGSTRETVASATAAASAGATVIAVTSFSRSPLTDVADIVLVAASRETTYRVEALASRVAHLMIIDALWMATATAHGDEAIALTRRIADVLSNHRY